MRVVGNIYGQKLPLTWLVALAALDPLPFAIFHFPNMLSIFIVHLVAKSRTIFGPLAALVGTCVPEQPLAIITPRRWAMWEQSEQSEQRGGVRQSCLALGHV